MADFDWKAIADIAAAGGKFLNNQNTNSASSAELQAAYDEVLKRLEGNLGDYKNTKGPTYEELAAQFLGPSELSKIPEDLRSRNEQQLAIAELKNLYERGGLSLGDKKTLNDINTTLTSQANSRNQALTDQYTARGQLGSGAQLAMSLANNQNANVTANSRAESIAAQAQDRALDALLKEASMARNMRNDDYMRKSRAAEAQDIINRTNAQWRTDASKYNNNLKQQGYDDKLRNLGGQTKAISNVNEALMGRANQKARTIGAQGANNNAGIDGIVQGGKSLFGQGGGNGTQNSTGGSSGSSYNTGGYEDGYDEDDEINFGDDD